MSNNTIIWIPVKIRDDILQRISGIAEKRHLQSESLINSILEQYVLTQKKPQKPSDDAAFLLSMAGMFESEEKDTSEHAHEIVKTCIENKHAKQNNN